MSHLPPPATSPLTCPPAVLDRRFSAFVLDRVVTWSLAGAGGYAVWALLDTTVTTALLAVVACDVLLGVVLAVLVGTTGLTPGKAAVGLRVVRRSTGRPIGVPAALGRYAVLGLATLPTLGIGLATLAWTAAADPGHRRRGLHDRIGDAVVVDVRPVPDVVEEDDPGPAQQIVNLTALRLMPDPPSQHPAPAPPVVATRSGTVPTPPPAWPPSVPSAAPAPAPPAPPAPPVRSPQPEEPPTREVPVLVPAMAATATVPPRVAPPPAPAPAPVPLAPIEPAGEQTRVRPDPADTTTQPATARWRVAFDTGESFVVEGLALVGRRPEPRSGEQVRHVVPLRSADMSLSKTHAQFQVAPDGALVVMDRGSTNGSYVVRRGLSKALSAGRPSTLLAGDEVRFGDRTMTVERED
ncbi:RDD family protein [Nocardioides sp. J54]|uniref:RDD family protein n=1 Tax=Nocardioides sp. J54 TaxID=935866 RepID=UPI0009FCC204|nr:RDD family protein [Nocardioides sp. J54]